MEILFKNAELIPQNGRSVVAIVAPHAGIRYSGAIAAAAFKQLCEKTHDDKWRFRGQISTIVLVGPLHQFRSEKATLWTSKYKVQQSPLGNLYVDTDLASLLKLPVLPINEDKAEHSIEMMFPFISYLMRHSTIPILPIYVSKDDGSHGAVVEKIWRHSSSTVFVFSSDFCHWGTRFQYCYLAPRCCDPIYMQIEELDTKAMQVLQKFCLQEWHAYLQRYGNTICGKDPLGLLMFLGCFLRDACGARLEWVKYAQSSKVTDMDESSVSYAAGSLSIENF